MTFTPNKILVDTEMLSISTVSNNAMVCLTSCINSIDASRALDESLKTLLKASQALLTFILFFYFRALEKKSKKLFTE